MTTKDRQRLFLVAMQGVNGNITKACELCQISRQTYYNWMEDDESTFADRLAAVQFESVERRIDLAEEKLDHRLNIGSGPDIRFVLKTLGAKRGYGSKAEVTLQPGAGFKDLEWPEETPELDDWEDARDDTVEEARVQSEARTASKPEGDGPRSRGQL